jgi:spermidine synthase
MLYLAFAASGAAALIYETTWTRLLTLFMGHTVAAASTVLAAFMGGLAVGAAIAGRAATGMPRPDALRAYAAVEVVIAVFAIALPWELGLLQPVVAAAYANGNGGVVFGLVRLVCALAVVTLPAIAMGATLPLAIRWHAGSAKTAGHDTGMLYASNTLGAALGAVLSGFVLLPAFGMRLTTFVGVALNIASAAIGWWLAKRRDAEIEKPVGPQRKPRPPRGSIAVPPAAPRLAAFALAISGCVSLILQIAWTRILALVVGPTTFAFSAMVATFIAGIAIGAAAGGALARRARSPWWLAGSLLLSGIGAVAAASWAPRVPLMVAEAVAAPDASFATVVRLQSAIIAALMMPMTVAFGAAFPLAVAIAARGDDRVPRDVAIIYTANTVGAIVGALAGGFVLVPALGLQNTVRAAALLAVFGFALVAIVHAGRRTASWAAIGITAAVTIGLVLLPRWDAELLSSGAYKYAPYLQGPHRDALLRAGTLLYYKEGAAGTVAVRRLTGAISLSIDGKVDASNAGDMLTQRLLAHVPLLLHPSPARVGIIGLGSGVTLGSALRHPISRADMLEISPEVVEASNFFSRENHDALRDPRTRLIVGDGRSHFALGDERYDVIISEPSNPWMAGVAALFTREFFEAARARLGPGGLLCQWAHTYDISDADLRSIVATFTAVFPHTSLWLVGEGDVLLIGSADPLEPRLQKVRETWTRAGVATDLAEVSVRDAETLLTLFTAADARLKSYAGDAPVQTDDRMSLEFSGPQGIYGRSTGNNAAALRALAHEGALPPAVREARNSAGTWTSRGLMYMRAEAFASAFDAFARALEHAPADEAAIDGLLRTAPAAQKIADAESLLRRITGASPHNVPAGVALSKIVAARGDFQLAAEPLRPLFAGQPDARVMDQLASLFADAGDGPRLAAAVADLQRVAPDSDSALYYDASLQFMAGRPEDAIRLAERLRARNGAHARALNLLGAAYATVGRRDDARRAFDASVTADPRDPTTYSNLGAFELEAGRPGAAADHFAEALTLDPSSAAAQDGLTRALAAMR